MFKQVLVGHFLIIGWCLVILSQVAYLLKWDSESLTQALFGRRMGRYDKMFSKFNESERLQMLQLARDTFVFAYDNYIEHAFPADELNPLFCKGRGPDMIDRFVFIFPFSNLF